VSERKTSKPSAGSRKWIRELVKAYYDELREAVKTIKNRLWVLEELDAWASWIEQQCKQQGSSCEDCRSELQPVCAAIQDAIAQHKAEVEGLVREVLRKGGYGILRDLLGPEEGGDKGGR